jgi:hypothetical protein
MERSCLQLCASIPLTAGLHLLTFVDDTVHAAAEQRQRLVVACTVVLVTFPDRAAVDVLKHYMRPLPIASLPHQNLAHHRCSQLASSSRCVTLDHHTGAHARVWFNVLRARLATLKVPVLRCQS